MFHLRRLADDDKMIMTPTKQRWRRLRLWLRLWLPVWMSARFVGPSRGERRGSHIFIVRTGCNEWPVWSGPPALGRRLGQVRRMTNTAGSTTTSSATTIKTTKTTTSSAQLVVSSSTLLSCNRKQKIHKEKIWRVTRANLEYPYKKQSSPKEITNK